MRKIDEAKKVLQGRKFIKIMNVSESTTNVINKFFDYSDTSIQMTSNEVEFLRRIDNDIYLRFDRDVHLLNNLTAFSVVDDIWKGVKSVTKEDNQFTNRVILSLHGLTETVGGGVFLGASTSLPPIEEISLPNMTSWGNGSVTNFIPNQPDPIPLRLFDVRSWATGTSDISFWDSYGNGNTDWCTDFTQLVVRAHLNCKTANSGSPQPWVQEIINKGGTVEWYDSNGALDSFN